MNCEIDDCDLPSYCKNKCKQHYEIQRRANLGVCSLESCSKKQMAKKLCRSHYVEQMVAGRPNCAIVDCSKPQYLLTSPMCKYHYDLDLGTALFGRYGIRINQFNAMMEEQNHKCAICALDVQVLADKKFKRFSVDHDHATGEVRGLLCNPCNLGLGHFKDNLELLQNAIQYLKKAKGKGNK